MTSNYVFFLICVGLLVAISATITRPPVDKKKAIRYGTLKLRTKRQVDTPENILFGAPHQDVPKQDVPIQQSEEFDVTIHLAAVYKAWLFVNGRYITRLSNTTYSRKVTLSVKNGDVIGVKSAASNHAYGVIISAFYLDKNHVSGGSDWKAHSFQPFDQDYSWRERGFSSCKWMTAEKIGMPVKEKRAVDFPYKTGSKYVWAGRGKEGYPENVLLRHVIGGEKCNEHVDENIETISGQSSEDPEYCRCKVTQGRKGKCWELQDMKKSEGRCVWRACDGKYECVSGNVDERGSRICMKRVALEKVVPSGVARHCKKMATRSVFYVLYQ